MRETYAARRARHNKAERMAVARLALAVSKRLEAEYAEYLEDCEQDRANGHRAHYCEHGTSNWTDFDNICGRCEDGYTNSTPQARRENALQEARNRMSAFADTLDAVYYLRGVNVTVDSAETSKRLNGLLDVNKRYSY